MINIKIDFQAFLAFNKVYSTILSCKTDEQMHVTANLYHNYERIYGKSEILIDLFYRKSQTILKPTI